MLKSRHHTFRLPRTLLPRKATALVGRSMASREAEVRSGRIVVPS